jgi:hypothetical protein
MTLTPDNINDMSAEKNPSAAAASLKDKVHDDASKFNLNGLDRSIIKRDEADLLKLEDSSSCDLVSRTSFQKIEPHQVVLDDLVELSQASNSSKTSNSRKRKFKNLQTAFDGP